ncbi:MAG: hypothetical protein KKB20_25805 [Proteobacteria bacterium]|nr:hypothetical protein [Pseudomonadota bacterium]
MEVTCSEHRATLLLLALKRKLAEDGLDPDERARLEGEAARLESELGMN